MLNQTLSYKNKEYSLNGNIVRPSCVLNKGKTTWDFMTLDVIVPNAENGMYNLNLYDNGVLVESWEMDCEIEKSNRFILKPLKIKYQ